VRDKYLVTAFANDPEHKGTTMKASSPEQAGAATTMLLNAGAVRVEVDNAEAKRDG
jgi:hypothetical protein